MHAQTIISCSIPEALPTFNQDPEWTPETVANQIEESMELVKSLPKPEHHKFMTNSHLLLYTRSIAHL